MSKEQYPLPERQHQRRTVLLDWGDTLMVDFAWFDGPMVSWPKVAAVEYAAESLAALRSDYVVVVITNAPDSDEKDIRAALERGGLGDLVDRIYCSRAVGHRKPSAEFFSYVLQDLKLQPDQAVMVGDDFEKDVLGANRSGIRAVWLNRFSDEIRSGVMYRTVHDLKSLPGLLDELFCM